MFRLSCEELQRRWVTKTIQTTKEMFKALGFDDLAEPGVKLEMSTAFKKVFKCYACIFNPEGGGEKAYAFDAHRFVESVCRVWTNIYGTVATSREEVLRDKALLEKDVKKLSDGEEGLVKKLAGDLDVCRQQLRTVQDSLKERGTTIAKLEQQIAALSIKPSNVSKPHIEPNAGDDQAAGSQKTVS